MKDVPLSPTVLAFVLLIISNCFMTLAWYGHLKFLHHAPFWQAILFGWTLGEMKITQEVVTLIVFVPFMVLLFKQPFKLDYVWAMLCLFGCVYFVFRSQ
ncbi:DMT family protein [Acinetobacter baumannii]